MPGPVPIDEFDKINFVLSAQRLGCQPPFNVQVKFAREPIGRLFLVMMTPDLDDMIKEWLRPGTDRYRKPARHGRKRNRIAMLTDPWNSVATSPIQAGKGIYPGIKLPGAKALFKVSDVADRVNWTSFLLESLVDIRFEQFLGALKLTKEGCENFAFVSRTKEGWTQHGGAGGTGQTTVFSILNNANGYLTTGPFSYLTVAGPSQLAYGVTIMANSALPTRGLEIVLRQTSGGQIIARSGAVDLEVGETVNLSLTANVPSGVSVWPGVNYQSGFFLIGPGELLAWANPTF